MSIETEPLSPTQQALRHFQSDTGEHELTVLMDTGDHRHLRFNKPGDSMYWFDLHTAPGLLTIHGDMGTYVFSRERDMFSWFGGKGIAGGINHDYWAEKLQAPKGRDGVKEWSEDNFRQVIEELTEDEATDLSEQSKERFTSDFQQEMFEGDSGYMPGSSSEAMQRLDDFRWEGEGEEISFSDVWDYDFREYEHSYLWCCWAIVWGIQQYRAAKATLPEGAATTAQHQTPSITPEARS